MVIGKPFTYLDGSKDLRAVLEDLVANDIIDLAPITSRRKLHACGSSDVGRIESFFFGWILIL